MSAAKHTPGPWKAIDGTAIWSEVFQTNTPIARANRRIGDTTHANARLIAAAPEMLEILREVDEKNTEALEAMKDADVTPPAWFIEQCERVSAMIEKATGSAS